MRDVLQLLVRELRPYKWQVVGSTALAFIAAGLDTVGPIMLGRGFDAAGKGSPLAIVGFLVLAWAGIRIAAGLTRSYITMKGSVIATEVADKFIRRSALSLLKKPLSFHYGKRNQESSDSLHDMRGTLEGLIMGAVFDLWPALVSMTAILGYVTWLDWRIAISLGVSSAALVAYSFATAGTTLQLHEAWRKAQHKASSATWDAIRNALVVKSTSNEGRVSERVEKLAAEALPLLKRDFAFDRQVRDMQDIIVALGSLGAVYFAVAAFQAGRFSFGQLTAVVAYAFTIFGYVRYCQWQARMYIRLSANYKVAKEILVVPDEDYDSGAPREMRGGVEFRGVRFRYREDKAALEDVSFSVAAGQRVAIVGESGEGKTTLVDLLGRYYEPQSGEILYDGVSAKDLNLRSLRGQMAYVPQDLTLFHDTIGYNIRYGRQDASDEDVHRAAKLAHMEAFIEGLPEKWETIVGERGLKLSGGERQRVALARAFLRDPRILVLDEPTAHLDSVTEGNIQTALAELMKGRTTFVIAHRLRTVMDADCILVLKDGRIAETGTHTELVARGGAYVTLLKAQGGFISPEEKHLGEVG